MKITVPIQNRISTILAEKPCLEKIRVVYKKKYCSRSLYTEEKENICTYHNIILIYYLDILFYIARHNYNVLLYTVVKAVVAVIVW